MTYAVCPPIAEQLKNANFAKLNSTYWPFIVQPVDEAKLINAWMVSYWRILLPLAELVPWRPRENSNDV